MERASRESRRWARREIKARKRGAGRDRLGKAVRQLRRVRARLVSIAIAVLIAGLASAAVAFWPQIQAAGSRSAGAPVDPDAVAPLYPTPVATGATTASPTAVAKVSPFAGSPVEKWAEGSAGLVVPASHRIGSFTTSQMADALQKTRAFVSAATLNGSVVYHGSYAPVVKVLDRYSVAYLHRDRQRPSLKNNPLFWVTRFDSRLVRAESGVVKVNGSMHARTKNRFLAVDFDYAFVYALADKQSDAARLVSVRRYGTLLFEPAPGNFRRVGQAFWSTGSYLNSGDVCDGKPSLTYLRVVFNDAIVPDISPEPGTTMNPLDVRRPVPHVGRCYTDSSGL